MKSEQEIKQVLENIKTAFNDDRDRSRRYSQAFSHQQIEALEWVLGLDDDWCIIERLKEYNKNVKPKKQNKKINT